jgi:hypothetical protein
MFPLTNAQKAAIQAVDDKVPELLMELQILRDDLRAAVVSLPHVNEDGDRVKHGSNIRCHRREDLIQHAIIQLGYLCT